MSKNSKRSILAVWDQVVSAAQANREDLALVEGPLVQLEASVEGLRILLSQRARLWSETMGKTQEIQSLVERGNDLVSRIRAGAKGRYGIHSEKLTEFGINPIRRQKSRDHPDVGCEETGAPRNPTAP